MTVQTLLVQVITAAHFRCD